MNKNTPRMNFFKYHALGNDYIVIQESWDQHWNDVPTRVPDTASIQQICHRNFGLGSDGILVPTPPPSDPPWSGPSFGLRIFNPDGSEAEKSGNGLRIFSRWLYDQGQVDDAPFSIWTLGGWVRSRLAPGGSPVTVAMGPFSFDSTLVPMLGSPRQVINEALTVGSETLHICALNLGNPHCVVLDAPVDEATARLLGPRIEVHPSFPNRTNVQFLRVLDRETIAIQIWERGAGYTLASGSSSCAAAAAAHRLGFTGAQVTVHCPGGALHVAIHPDDTETLTGPVTPIASGIIHISG